MPHTTILIVDDEPAILTAVGALLQPHYRVRVANSGAHALLAAASQPRPDLILLDVMMPEMDGYDALTALKMDPNLREIPVIIITGSEATTDEERALRLGAVDYITKPIREAVLLARVRTHIMLRQAHDFLVDKNEYLEAEIRRRMRENRLIQNVSIRALAHLAEIRDDETGAHIVRTQRYVEILALGLRKNPKFTAIFTNKYIDLLARSAPLHDIGKVGIPDSILLKPGRLTVAEFDVMKTHSALGAHAIELAERDVDQPVAFLTLAKEIARSHHEKWDGSGYPDGLNGDAIPISARLMALADVFDALVSKRVYKAAMSVQDARQIILDGSGLHFDPAVVAVFDAEFGQFLAVARHRSDTATTRSGLWRSVDVSTDSHD